MLVTDQAKLIRTAVGDIRVDRAQHAGRDDCSTSPTTSMSSRPRGSRKRKSPRTRPRSWSLANVRNAPAMRSPDAILPDDAPAQTPDERADDGEQDAE